MSDYGYGRTPSVIGDQIPQQRIYVGYMANILFAGASVAGAEEIRVEVDNNASFETEIGSRHSLPITGRQEVRGTLRGFYFDTMKFRLAIGKAYRDVGQQEGIIEKIDDGFRNTYSYGLEGGTPGFGSADWFRLFRFDIAVGLRRVAAGTITESTTSYIVRDALINNWNIVVPKDEKVRETIEFMAPSIETLET